MESEHGISFTEFSYMLLQANDYLWLHEREGCELQIGGSDQWGNITAGIDLIRRRRGRAGPRPHLAAAAAVRRPEVRQDARPATSGSAPSAPRPYRFFQYWMQVARRRRPAVPAPADAAAGRRDRAVVGDHAAAPERRDGQRRAGPGGHDARPRAARRPRRPRRRRRCCSAATSTTRRRRALERWPTRSPTRRRPAAWRGSPWWTLLAETGLAASKGEARRSPRPGRRLRERRTAAPGRAAASAPADLLHGRYVCCAGASGLPPGRRLGRRIRRRLHGRRRATMVVPRGRGPAQSGSTVGTEGRRHVGTSHRDGLTTVQPERVGPASDAKQARRHDRLLGRVCQRKRSLKTEQRTQKPVRATALVLRCSAQVVHVNSCTKITDNHQVSAFWCQFDPRLPAPMPALHDRRPPATAVGSRDLDGEFDPGSGRTLAACLTHASRARSIQWQHWVKT